MHGCDLLIYLLFLLLLALRVRLRRVLSAKVAAKQSSYQSAQNTLSNLGSVTCFFAATVCYRYNVTFLMKVVERRLFLHPITFQLRPCSTKRAIG